MMRKNRNIIFNCAIYAVIFSQLLLGCNEESKTDSIIPDVSYLNKKPPITAKWKYTNSIFYAADLQLFETGNFTFHSHSCTGQAFTSGKWTMINGNIVSLTSDSSFLPEQHQTLVTHYRHKPNRNKNTNQYLVFEGSVIFPQPGDTTKIFFDRARLALQNDTLFSMNHQYLENHHFFRNVVENQLTFMH